VFVRQKLEAIEQSAAPAQSLREIQQQDDRRRRSERREQLKEAAVDAVRVPRKLAPLVGAGLLHVEPEAISARDLQKLANDGLWRFSHAYSK
jgi:hypothetical protein